MNVCLFILCVFLLYTTGLILMTFFVCLIGSVNDLYSQLEAVGSTREGAQTELDRFTMCTFLSIRQFIFIYE